MKNIIFDLGGVVVDWSPEKVLNEYKGDKQFIIDLFEGGFFNNYWVEFDRGTLTQEQVQFEMAQFSGRPYEECKGLVDYIKYSLTDIPETIELIKILHQEGYHLYCLSNMSNEFYDYLKRRDVFTYFKGQIISAHEKLVKPEPAIYQLILDRFDLKADESLFIDDLQPNVEAAEKLGIHTVRFAPRDKGYRDIAIKLGRA